MNMIGFACIHTHTHTLTRGRYVFHIETVLCSSKGRKGEQVVLNRMWLCPCELQQ